MGRVTSRNYRAGITVRRSQPPPRSTLPFIPLGIVISSIVTTVTTTPPPPQRAVNPLPPPPPPPSRPSSTPSGFSPFAPHYRFMRHRGRGFQPNRFDDRTNRTYRNVRRWTCAVYIYLTRTETILMGNELINKWVPYPSDSEISICGMSITNRVWRYTRKCRYFFGQDKRIHRDNKRNFYD